MRACLEYMAITEAQNDLDDALDVVNAVDLTLPGAHSRWTPFITSDAGHDPGENHARSRSDG